MLMDVLAPVLRILRHFGYLLFLFWRAVELVIIVWPVEGAMRLWHRRDPRIHRAADRIRSVTDGRLPKKNDKYVVFLLYTKTSLPPFTANAIDALARSDHNLVIVSNAELSPSLRADLLARCHRLIERHNVGRDFGGYKDGVNAILETCPGATRIAIMNDSVYFFEKNLDALFDELMADRDFTGVTEVHQFHYHVQSFMLSFGQAVIRSPAFVGFWKDYLPIGTRRFAIHNGEIALTRTLTQAGFRPHILYQAAELIPHLEARPARAVLEEIKWLPAEMRDTMYEHVLALFGTQYSASSFAVLEALAYGVTPLRDPLPDDHRDDPLARLNGQAATLDRYSLGIVAHQIVSSIAKHNQMHHGGFLFAKHLGLPLMKRDIFFRELYTLEDVHRFLTAMDEPLRDEVLADLRRSGSGAHLTGLRRLLYRHGSV